MATKFEFYLSDEDTDRLFAVKDDKGLSALTGNEYAKKYWYMNYIVCIQAK